MSEHFLIRNARTLTFNPVCRLQPTLDNIFIGAIQYIGEHPKSYTMEAVVEAVQAHKEAIRIANEREDQARQDAARAKQEATA